MANYLDIKDARIYMNSILQSSQDTYKILRQYYEIIISDFENVLKQDSLETEDCKNELIEKLNIFDKKVTDIEKYIEEEIVNNCKVEDVGDGWHNINEPIVE